MNGPDLFRTAQAVVAQRDKAARDAADLEVADVMAGCEQRALQGLFEVEYQKKLSPGALEILRGEKHLVVENRTPAAVEEDTDRWVWWVSWAHLGA